VTSDPAPPENLRPIVIRGVLLAGAGNFLTQIITLASYIVLARLAPPVVFGAFAAASALVGFGVLFAQSGMLAALIQRRERVEEAAATAVVSTVLSGVGLSLGALALAPIVGIFFQSHEIALVAAALSGTLFLTSVTVVPDALLQRRFSFLRRMVVDPLNMLAYGVTGAVALAQGMGVWGLVLASYVAGIVQMTATWGLCRWKPDLRQASYATWRELMRYAKHILASEILRHSSNLVNIALIGRFIGIAPLGQYRIAWRLANQGTAPLVAASAYVLLPAFARISDDEERFRAAVLRALSVLALVVFPLALIVLPLGEQIVALVLGEPWRRAGQVLAALCGVIATAPLISVSSETFKASAHPELVARMHALQALSSILLIVAFLPLGIIGIAVGVSLSFVAVTAYALHAASRVLRVSFHRVLAVIRPPLIAAVGMTLCLYALQRLAIDADRGSALLQLGLIVLQLGIGACTYFALLILVAPNSARELADGLRYLARRVPKLRGSPTDAGPAGPPT
jgi:PST family polysaccharide transporter